MASNRSITMTLSFLRAAAPLLAKGMLTTCALWLSSAIISLSLGTLTGIARSNKMRKAYVSSLLDIITFVLRGIPYYTQLLIAYFVLPNIFGINFSAIHAAILSLGLCSAAYVSQIVCGTIDALPEGQWEACFVLGYSQFQTLFYVILPQVVRNALPIFTNELDQLLKSTAIISSIGVLELTRVGINIIAREMNPTPVYLTTAVIYLAGSWILARVSGLLARRVSYIVR